MKTHKFARKPFYVDAVRVSEANIEEVAEWCDGKIQTNDEGKFISVKVHRPLTERQTQAFIGDWVLFAGTGFKVYVPKAFDKSFEKVKTLTKAQADEAGIKVPHEKSQRPAPAKKVPSPKDMVRATQKGSGRTATVPREETEVDYRSAKTGQFVSEEEAAANPDTTVREVTPPRSKADVEADKLIAEVEALKER